MSLHRFLDRLTSRSVLTPEEQQAVLDLPAHIEQVRSNRDFVRLGEHVEHSCLVVAGMVGRFDQTVGGLRQIVAIHIPGDMADLHSVVQPTATSALQALAVSTILKIPHSAIRAAVARYPTLAQAFWRDCMVDAALLGEWVLNVGRRTARARIAHIYCEMAIRLDVAPSAGDTVFQFPITQLQLADATGLTPVHVNRTMMGLRREEIMTVHGENVWVHDWQALAKAGDFDANYLQRNVRPQQPMRLPEDG